jgi:hypothetical protein
MKIFSYYYTVGVAVANSLAAVGPSAFLKFDASE